MWHKKENPRTAKVTRSLVKEFVEMDPAPNDRPLSEKRLQVYRRILADHQFRPCVWASVFCKDTNCDYRVNGKHTSLMLSGANTELKYFSNAKIPAYK